MSNAGILTRPRRPVRRAGAIIAFGEGPGAAVVRAGKISTIEACEPLQEERLHQEAGITDISRELHRLRCQVRAQPEIATDDMKGKMASHHRESLRRFPAAFS